MSSKIEAPDNSSCTVIFANETGPTCPPTGFFTDCLPVNYPPETACVSEVDDSLCFSGYQEPCNNNLGLRFCCIGDLTTNFPTFKPTPYPTISAQQTRELYVDYPSGFVPNPILLPRGVEQRNASTVLFMPENLPLSLSDDRYVYRTVGFIVRESDEVVTEVILNTLARATGVFPLNRFLAQPGYRYIEKRPLRSVFIRTSYAEVDYGFIVNPNRQQTQSNCLIFDSSATIDKCRKIPRCAGVLDGICYVGLSVFDEPNDPNGIPPPSKYTERLLDNNVNSTVWIVIFVLVFFVYVLFGLPWKRILHRTSSTEEVKTETKFKL